MHLDGFGFTISTVATKMKKTSYSGKQSQHENKKISFSGENSTNTKIESKLKELRYNLLVIRSRTNQVISFNVNFKVPL